MTATTDPFAALLGTVRGAGRSDSDNPEVVSVAQRRRLTLALIAAYGILAHNSAVSMPGTFAVGRIAALVEHGGQPNLPSESPVTDELVGDLRALAAAGFLIAIEGERWRITPAGLVALWTGIAD